jgi:histone acetyltransferase HTATIP
MHHWSQTLARTILAVPAKRTFTIADLRDETYITVEDIIQTLQSMDVLEYKNGGGGEAVVNKTKVRAWAEWNKIDLKNPVNPEAFAAEINKENNEMEEP